MLKRFLDWFHHLINPHCEQCRIEHEEMLLAKRCKSCEVYSIQLDLTNARNAELINQIIELSNPKEETRTINDGANYKPISRGSLKFSDRRAKLERLSRNRTEPIIKDLNPADKVKFPTNAVEMEEVIKASN